VLKTPFARTAPDQAAERPEAPRFIGERNTRATSDRAPDPDAPPMPSQAGIDDKRDIETTESRYRDGELDSGAPSSATPPTPPPAPPPAALAAEAEALRTPADEPAAPPQERLAEGPNPVDREVAKEKPAREKPKPAPARRAEEAKPEETAAKAEPARDSPKPAAPASAGKPGFTGFQRKTQIRGSISRRGTSALDVEDSPLGRYQAAISRAVERQWQRNCVRYRDLITPGFLTVRFVVESSGKVRSVGFVESADSGEVQKGFTLSSIREAEIPPMSAELKKQLNGEPLELIFNFYF
jgi:outer membrane biosynthesis protein TonB